MTPCRSSVTITVEIEATAEGGFSEEVRRAVDENARTGAEARS